MDRAAFEQIVRQHHGEVYRSAWRILRNEADAEDVTQHVFLDVAGGLLERDAPRDAGRHLRWRAVRRALTEIRGARNRRRREEHHAMPREPAVPADAAASEETRRELWRLVDELPDDLRLAVVLRFHEGLTFAAVADALTVSEPTVHQRVGRALERLRRRLSGSGLEAHGPSLPLLLAGRLPVPVPAGLEGRLLALPAGAAAASGVPLAAVIAAVLVLAGGGAWLLTTGGGASREQGRQSLGAGEMKAGDPPAADGKSPPPETIRPLPFRPEPLTTRPETPPPDPPPVPGRAQSPQPVTAVIDGRVTNEKGAPLEGVEVHAEAGVGKGEAEHHVTGATDAGGMFRLEVPVPARGARAYRLRTRHSDYVMHVGGAFDVQAGRRPPFQELVLSVNTSDRPGAWELVLEVVDEQERPAAGHRVRVSRRVADRGGRLGERTEAEAETDAAGLVRLAGGRLGEKLVQVWRAGAEPHAELLRLREPGEHFRTVRLGSLQAIRGTVRDADGNVPDRLSLAAHLPGSYRPEIVRVGPDGAFAFEDLPQGGYSVDVCDHRWSPLGLDAVRPGGPPLDIVLKPRHEPSARGTHAAEIHGRVFDAETGRELQVEEHHVWAERIPDDSGADLSGDVLPALLAPFQGQVAVSMRDDPVDGFHVVGLDAGTWVVKIDMPGRAVGFSRPVRLARSEVVADVRVELGRGSTRRGVVTDAGGRPVAGAWVYATGVGPRSERTLRARDAVVSRPRATRHAPFGGAVRTDARGRFTIDRLPRGLTLRLGVLHASFQPAFSPPLGAGAVPEVRISLDRRRR